MEDKLFLYMSLEEMMEKLYGLDVDTLLNTIGLDFSEGLEVTEDDTEHFRGIVETCGWSSPAEEEIASYTLKALSDKYEESTKDDIMAVLYEHIPSIIIRDMSHAEETIRYNGPPTMKGDIVERHFTVHYNEATSLFEFIGSPEKLTYMVLVLANQASVTHFQGVYEFYGAPYGKDMNTYRLMERTLQLMDVFRLWKDFYNDCHFALDEGYIERLIEIETIGSFDFGERHVYRALHT